MKLNLFKIYSRDRWARLGRDLLGVIGSSPRNYWGRFLLLFAFLFLSALAVNVYLLLALWQGRSRIPVEIVDEAGPKINLSGLSSAVKIIRDKEAEFRNTADLPAVSDPSL